MAKYDEDERLKLEEAKRRQNMPDEDGFVLVQRTGKRGSNRAGDITATAAAASSIKKKDEKVVENFYTFQAKAKKLEGMVRASSVWLSWIAELSRVRRQFEEDKSRIERMRGARKFKPYS